LPRLVCRSPSSVAGRWVFPASALALVRYRTGLRGLPSAVVEKYDRSRISRHPSSPSSLPSHLSAGVRSPLRRHPLAHPLPVALASFLRSLGSHLGFSFRPRGFSPPRRLSPRWSCGLVASRCRSWGSPRYDLDAHTPRRTPSPAAVPCHHGRCPLAVLPCRSSRLASPSVARMRRLP
jgi:hypothetical protein